MEKTLQVRGVPVHTSDFDHKIWFSKFSGWNSQGRGDAHHLFFTIKEPIKHECWCISHETNTVRFIKPPFSDNLHDFWHKIKATTDKELQSDDKTKGGLPKIDVQFVDQFLKQNGDIKEVMLEYEYNGATGLPMDEEQHQAYSPKLTPDEYVIVTNVVEDKEKMLARLLLKYVPLEQFEQMLDDLKSGNFRIVSSNDKNVYDIKGKVFTREEFKKHGLEIFNFGMSVQNEISKPSFFISPKIQYEQWFDKKYPEA